MAFSISYSECLKQGEIKLRDAGIEDAAYDSWYWLSEIFEISRSQYYMKLNDVCDEEKYKLFMDKINLRAKRVPLQYIENKAYFMNYEFYVNENVLIPRYDTEILVEKVFEKIKEIASATDREIKILDMCTGSGCIAISLFCMALENNIKCNVTACDLSEKALEVAAINNKRLCDNGITLKQGNLFEALSDTDEFDIIVSNPPYIKRAQIDYLMPEVKDHEPRMALDGMEDGLYFYRKIADSGYRYLSNEGSIMFEIGCAQGYSVPDILEKSNYKNIKVYKDYSRFDRVVTAVK